ncbi:MAG: glutaredoxin family protein [Gammaproteobacteria bacterium]
MEPITLYTRDECHLCDVAADLVAEVAPERGLVKVDIEDDLALLERYGVRIPVLRRPEDGAELGWPFDEAALRAFVGA